MEFAISIDPKLAYLLVSSTLTWISQRSAAGLAQSTRSRRLRRHRLGLLGTAFRLACTLIIGRIILRLSNPGAFADNGSGHRLNRLAFLLGLAAAVEETN